MVEKQTTLIQTQDASERVARTREMRGKRRARVGARAVMVALAVLSSLSGARAMWGAKSTQGRAAGGDRVCFIAATVPWTFGAYQAQAWGLSKAFAEDGYETLWMPRAPSVRLPEGTYATWEDAYGRFKGDVRKPTEAEAAAMKHLTFLGVPNVPHPMGSRAPELSLTMRQLNEASSAYDVDAFILLVDFGQVYPDADAFRVPTVLWMPYHHEQSDNSALLLSTYTGIAALAESTRRAVERVQPLTRTIPHFIDREALNTRADAFERTLRAEVADEGSLRRVIFDSKKLDRSFTRTIDAVDDDTFLVLMQGGNYENSDRKGWLASIEAFATFQRENPDVKTHLWIHSMDSTMTQKDMNHNTRPPVAVVRTGVNLRSYLQLAGIPSNTYTLDENMHDRDFTSALKRHADVCLHTSKAEGFGMVVLECQALGTPVVTTNYTAMRDYTRLGLAVEPAAYEAINGAKFAIPDSRAAAKALRDIAVGVASLPTRESIFDWIDTEFSLDSVHKRFVSILNDAKVEYKKRKVWSTSDTFKKKPIFTVTTDAHPKLASWDTPWTLYHHPDIKVDYEKIQNVLIDASLQRHYAFAIAQTTQNGRTLPLNVDDGIHHVNPHYVVIMRTWMMRQMQEQHSYVWSIFWQLSSAVEGQNAFLPISSGMAELSDTNSRRDEL